MKVIYSPNNDPRVWVAYYKNQAFQTWYGLPGFQGYPINAVMDWAHSFEDYFVWLCLF